MPCYSVEKTRLTLVGGKPSPVVILGLLCVPPCRDGTCHVLRAANEQDPSLRLPGVGDVRDGRGWQGAMAFEL